MPIADNSIDVHDLVKVSLDFDDINFTHWNGRHGYVVSNNGAGRFIIGAVDDGSNRIEVPLSLLRKVTSAPAAVRGCDQTPFKYTLVLQEHEYTRLMQLVMKYGTGTGEGESTPTSLRLALANAVVSVDNG